MTPGSRCLARHLSTGQCPIIKPMAPTLGVGTSTISICRRSPTTTRRTKTLGNGFPSRTQESGRGQATSAQKKLESVRTPTTGCSTRATAREFRAQTAWATHGTSSTLAQRALIRPFIPPVTTAIKPTPPTTRRGGTATLSIPELTPFTMTTEVAGSALKTRVRTAFGLRRACRMRQWTSGLVVAPMPAARGTKSPDSCIPYRTCQTGTTATLAGNTPWNTRN
mmetsp:Transcript_11178/g.25428  ORF Transcript_11178/g.25428 Transcript_11178/m.25428 type:complete len:223 (+) Transcript_11178:170-838(+)